jgi:hypothetical protein
MVTGVALALGLGLAAYAAPPNAADPEANVVEELVVVSRHPAPAWWRVEKDGATVWILGVLDGPLPKDLTWRRQELDEHLKDASALLTGPQLHAGLGDIVGLFKLYGMLRTQDMEASLDPRSRARFVADREKLGKGQDRYDHWRPMIAGQMLLRDSRPEAVAEVGRQVRSEAKKAGIPIKPAGDYDLIPFAKAALTSLTPVSEGECLNAALDDTETDPAVWKKAAAGWARGDVGAALTAPRRFDRCLLLMAGGPELWRSSTDDLAGAIAEALGKPGHAVATVPLRRLVAKGGLIESLKARGLTVIGPDGDPV